MCAACVGQSALYVGTALGALRLMGARARTRRRPADAASPLDEVIDEIDTTGAEGDRFGVKPGG
jgi:hypothetical protein